MARFTFEHLSFSYPGSDRQVLDDVTFDVAPGSYVVLCGQSGCGKTTLLRHVKTPLRPVGQRLGRVLVNGEPIDSMSIGEQARTVGFVMQDPDAQIVTDKVWHELAFGLESLGVDAQEMRMRVAEMASFFNIQRWFDRDVHTLSGGQKQLLNLAAVMAMQPSALVLDEPTSQLDPIAAADFLNTVRKINIELGTTILITEHRLEDIYSRADAVAVLDEGRLVAWGSPREVGDALSEQDHVMQAALPAPMRIYYGVADAQPQAIARLEHSRPITVREGRTWLADMFATKDPAYVSVEEIPDQARIAAHFTANAITTANATTAANIANTTIATNIAAATTATNITTAPKAAISAKNLWLRYTRDSADVLKGVNFVAQHGRIHAVVGGNGTGKSTLLKALAGVEKPYRGSIKLLGKPLNRWKSSELFNGGVAMLPQDPSNVFVKHTVVEDLEEMLDGMPQAQRKDAVHQVARAIGIEAVLDAHPLDLSGGEMQRAALAKVLLCQPQVLLLDEPTKGIDCFFKRKLARVLRELAVSGVAVVMVSHDIEFCAHYADEVSMFFNGEVVSTNTPRALFAKNSFYTTAANRMSRSTFENAVTDEDVIALCCANLQEEARSA